MFIKEVSNHYFFKRRCLKFFLSIAFISGLLILNSSSSESYTLHQDRIIGTPITYIPHGNFDSATISGFNDMLYNWNAQAGKSLVFREPYIRHYDSSENSYDNLSKVYRMAVSQHLAYARTRTDSYGRVIESDIVVNISYPYANGAVSGRYDVQSVLLHEAGHSIGIDHSQYSDAVMWSQMPTNTIKRTLSNDDRLAVNAKYK